MKLRMVFAIILILSFVAVLVGLNLSEPDQVKENPPSNPPVTNNPSPLVLTRSSQCKTCHPEVYEEWAGSWHALAWKDPLVRDKNQSDNFRKKDCIPCHAPRPVFERGIRSGERVVERMSNRDDGVDCISCHKLPGKGFAASTKNAQGPCNPVFHPKLASEDLCAPCHNQHNTVEEWKAVPDELRGENCNTCHMPEKIRKARPGQPEKIGRDHTFMGGHYPEMLKKAFTLTHEIKESAEGKTIEVRLKNDKTAHNFPTDSRHRALDLIVHFYDSNGIGFSQMDEGKREFGQEEGAYRLRFRNPYRSETGKKDTQIRAGEEAVLLAPAPQNAKKARIQLIFKLTPFLEDKEGFLLYEKDLSL